MSLGTAPSTMRRGKQAEARALEPFSSNQTGKVEASLAKESGKNENCYKKAKYCGSHYWVTAEVCKISAMTFLQKRSWHPPHQVPEL